MAAMQDSVTDSSHPHTPAHIQQHIRQRHIQYPCAHTPTVVEDEKVSSLILPDTSVRGMMSGMTDCTSSVCM